MLNRVNKIEGYPFVQLTSKEVADNKSRYASGVIALQYYLGVEDLTKEEFYDFLAHFNIIIIGSTRNTRRDIGEHRLVVGPEQLKENTIYILTLFESSFDEGVYIAGWVYGHALKTNIQDLDPTSPFYGKYKLEAKHLSPIASIKDIILDEEETPKISSKIKFEDFCTNNNVNTKPQDHSNVLTSTGEVSSHTTSVLNLSESEILSLIDFTASNLLNSDEVPYKQIQRIEELIGYLKQIDSTYKK